jgi:hypothetical protein
MCAVLSALPLRSGSSRGYSPNSTRSLIVLSFRLLRRTPAQRPSNPNAPTPFACLKHQSESNRPFVRPRAVGGTELDSRDCRCASRESHSYPHCTRRVVCRVRSSGCHPQQVRAASTATPSVAIALVVVVDRCNEQRVWLVGRSTVPTRRE